MKVEATFQLSGDGDILTMNGRSDIRSVSCPPVPEFPVPFFPVAGLIGLVCLVMLVRLRKN
jgi:hypothetical protein